MKSKTTILKKALNLKTKHPSTYNYIFIYFEHVPSCVENILEFIEAYKSAKIKVKKQHCIQDKLEQIDSWFENYLLVISK